MNWFKRMLRYSLEKAGYKLHRFNPDQIVPSSIPDCELYTGPEDFSRLFKPWLSPEYDRWFTPEVVQNTMLSRQKLYWLLKLLRQTLSLEGDVFEAGVGSGGSARLMLDCLVSAKSAKHLWLLDTFEGYQKVDATKDGAHVQVNQCRCNSREAVARLLTNTIVPVHLIEGIIPATLLQVKANPIAFAHIDVNLYEPTLAATEFCLQRMPTGGAIVFDDYCWPATYGARAAIDEACARTTQEVIAVPESTQAFLVKS